MREIGVVAELEHTQAKGEEAIVIMAEFCEDGARVRGMFLARYSATSSAAVK